MKKLFVLSQSIMNGTVTMDTVETVFSTRELAEETMEKLKAEDERRRIEHETEQQKMKERIYKEFNRAFTCADGNKIRVDGPLVHIVNEPRPYFPSYFCITECNLIETEEDLKENGFEL